MYASNVRNECLNVKPGAGLKIVPNVICINVPCTKEASKAMIVLEPHHSELESISIKNIKWLEQIQIRATSLMTIIYILIYYLYISSKFLDNVIE